MSFVVVSRRREMWSNWRTASPSPKTDGVKFFYDRIVIAKGTRVRGHITGIDSGSALVRTRAYLAGNFSPPKHAMLQFDTLLLDDGREMSIDTVVKGAFPM